MKRLENYSTLISEGRYPLELNNILKQKMTFGKYKCFTYEYIINIEPQYIVKLSFYHSIPIEIKEWAKEHVRFRINQYMPLNGNITELLKRKAEKNKNKAEYIFGDNYSKHEMM